MHDEEIKCKIDFECQKQIEKRKIQNAKDIENGVPYNLRKSGYNGFMKIYEDEFIAKLKEIGDNNMKKLDTFFSNNKEIDLDTDENELLRKAGVETAIYLSNAEVKDMKIRKQCKLPEHRNKFIGCIDCEKIKANIKQDNAYVPFSDFLEDEDLIGKFIHVGFWLKDNEKDFIMNMFDCKVEDENLNIDQVLSFVLKLKFLLKCFYLLQISSRAWFQPICRLDRKLF